MPKLYSKLMLWPTNLARLRMLPILVLLASVCCSVLSLMGSDTAGLIRETGSGIFSRSGAPAMALVVVKDGHPMVFGFGKAQPGTAGAPEGRSLVRVGSISKVLATELLLKLEEQGKLRLTDPLQRYAPVGGTVPASREGQPLTLLHLATHTSGLPRSVESPVPPRAIPFSWPSQEDRWQALSKIDAVESVGRAALYSNAAFDFLGDAIAAAGAKPYEMLLRETITEPLGMHDTTATPTEEQCGRLLGGSRGDPTGPCGDTRATASSGGIYSTPDDMGRWINHLLESQSASIRSGKPGLLRAYFPRKTLTPVEGLDHAGEASAVGLGWIALDSTEVRPAIMQKTGGGGGFMSYIALAPTKNLGVFAVISKKDLEAGRRLARGVNELIGELSRR